MGAIVGFCTSGGYSHWMQRSVAIGFLPSEMIVDGLDCTIEILGAHRKAKVHLAPIWNDGGRMRG